MKRRLLISLFAAACVFGDGAVHAADLRIGIQEDPDLLDPAQGGSFVDRIVFTALCDKLVDIGPRLDYVPQLATEWSWAPDALSLTMKLRAGVVFHDGEKFDAAAVKYNIDRYRTLPESRRKGELAPVAGVDVVDDLTVRFNLSQAYAPLLGVLSDRAGMMVSPKAAEAAGARFFANPVCSGPYRFVERIAQDRIVLRKFDGYRDQAAYLATTVTYRPMPDPTIRLANLRSGQLDLIERVNPTDLPQIRADARVRLIEVPSVAYQTLALNLNNGPRANTDFAKNPKIREALELSIDRTVLNQVVFNGEYIPSNQPLAPGDPYHATEFPVPKRDVARARQLLAQAGCHPRAADHLCGDQPCAAAGGAGDPVDGLGDGLRRQDRGHGGGHRHAAHPRRRFPGRDRRLERPARSRRQHLHLARLQWLPELGQVLRREAGRPVAARQSHDRAGRTPCALSPSIGDIPLRAISSRPLSPEMALGDGREAQGLRALSRTA